MVVVEKRIVVLAGEPTPNKPVEWKQELAIDNVLDTAKIRYPRERRSESNAVISSRA
jgi:hypothetical protein